MQNSLKNILSLFKDKKIIVWGDFILDEYVFTTTGRISREAPVLVTEFESNEFLLGGAGNVILNIKSLGAEPLPIGFTGKNADGRVLKNILHEKGITTEFLVELENYRTPKKSRIMSGGDNTKKQQVLRIDRLNRSDIDDSAYGILLERLYNLLDTPGHDIVVISDYIAKSVKPHIFDKIREQFPNKHFIVDSRQHLMRFKNISIATPNEPELKSLFPEDHFYTEQKYYDAGHQLRKRLGADGIILKRGHKGMIVFEKDKQPELIDIHGSANIVDVTGAGDTVISVVSLALAAGAGLVPAARLATVAAGYVVMKEGAYPIHFEELQHELDQIS